ncbi:MAG: hypothetical protein UT39_C0022G0006 [Candidatus Woesebacteria bacterium GW2011_GWA1_39_21]|uniref:Uncharacterized protein n=1 Tax=Candidatus Woesebacteria bacterium GW2011_GWA1_39_21 TaxID=1618550 RepID=A0A0G0R8Y6_9BACT|nr:MAG: hypothetical protein UT39_C0022G0006 [Candidatus Woesebacteria bacterium GW2011_GWA1_39_21]
MRKVFISLILIIFPFLLVKNVYAIENPTAADNNKFGIHIIDENDLDDATRLVNSSGGDWGYVTFVIREDERDPNRWQKVFDRARRLHLIPIVRIATKQDGDNWSKPDPDDISGWVNFFDSLNWVVINRYVVIGNETNHASEWGGEVNPTEYGDYFINIAKRIKVSNPDYFVMMGAFDASAPDNKAHMSEERYLTKLLQKYPKIFDDVDGFASHSYPNPDFSAPPTNKGQKSVRAYEWELSLLKRLGVKKDLPVFVTETGWAHQTDSDKTLLGADSLNDYYKSLYEIYLNDERVVAFTPFVLNYSSPPFDKFSWKKTDGTFYPFFEATQKVLKIKGQPHRITDIEILFEIVPQFIKKDDKVYAVGVAKNWGQSIWLKDTKITGDEHENAGRIEIDSPLFTDVEPGKIGIILYRRL